jgi:hypothetical protein
MIILKRNDHPGPLKDPYCNILSHFTVNTRIRNHNLVPSSAPTFTQWKEITLNNNSRNTDMGKNLGEWEKIFKVA